GPPSLSDQLHEARFAQEVRHPLRQLHANADRVRQVSRSEHLESPGKKRQPVGRRAKQSPVQDFQQPTLEANPTLPAPPPPTPPPPPPPGLMPPRLPLP